MKEVVNSDFIKKMPKAELHVHFEATPTVELIQKFAVDNKEPLPDGLLTDDGKVNWKKGDFNDFLKKYDSFSRMLRTSAHITEAAFDYLKRSHEEGVIYTELTVSPEHFVEFGLTFEQVVKAVAAGIKQAEKECDIDARILIVLVRHLGKDKCEKTADNLIKYFSANKENTYIVGAGLAGNEIEYPPSLFKDAFKKIRDAGLQVTAHAGEWTNAQDVRNAIEELGVTRIGHGVHAAFDPTTIEMLKKKKIHLEICPSSNNCLETHHPSFPKDPFVVFDEEGVSYSVSTDDPVFFRWTMTDEYIEVQRRLNLTSEELLNITRNAIEASFAPEHLKEKLRLKLRAFAEKNGIQLDPKVEPIQLDPKVESVPKLAL